MPDTPLEEAPLDDELTDPEYTGAMKDPIILVLNRHQWLRIEDFRGMCLCGETGPTTPLGYKQHVRRELLAASEARAVAAEREGDALREAAHIGIELDNHHNAARCPYCQEPLTRAEAVIEAAREVVLHIGAQDYGYRILTGALAAYDRALSPDTKR